MKRCTQEIRPLAMGAASKRVAEVVKTFDAQRKSKLLTSSATAHRVPRRRQGAALILVIACLIIFTMLTSTMIRFSLIAARQLKQQRNYAQATWLAESGIERAVASLQNNADYDGETWQIPASELTGKSPGSIDITVDRTEDQLTVNVIANYPVESTFKTQVTKQVFVDPTHIARTGNE